MYDIESLVVAVSITTSDGTMHMFHILEAGLVEENDEHQRVGFDPTILMKELRELTRIVWDPNDLTFLEWPMGELEVFHSMFLLNGIKMGPIKLSGEENES